MTSIIPLHTILLRIILLANTLLPLDPLSIDYLPSDSFLEDDQSLSCAFIHTLLGVSLSTAVRSSFHFTDSCHSLQHIAQLYYVSYHLRSIPFHTHRILPGLRQCLAF